LFVIKICNKQKKLDHSKGPKNPRDLQSVEHQQLADTIELPVIQPGCPVYMDEILQEYVCGSLPSDIASFTRAMAKKNGEVDGECDEECDVEDNAETRLRLKIESSVNHVNSVFDLIDNTLCFQVQSIRATNSVYRTTFNAVGEAAAQNIRCRRLSQKITKTILPLLRRLSKQYEEHERIGRALLNSIRNFESIESDLKDLAVLW
jgi:hypothetical protein